MSDDRTDEPTRSGSGDGDASGSAGSDGNRTRSRRRGRNRGSGGGGGQQQPRRADDPSSKDGGPSGDGGDQGGGHQGGGKGRRNKRRRGKRRGSRQRSTGVGFWGDVERLPAPDSTVRISSDPAAVPRSLGHPPLPGHERMAQNYFELVYTRATTTAGAVAAAGGLIEPDDLLEELGNEEIVED